MVGKLLVLFQFLPQPKLVLNLATPEGCKAKLTRTRPCIRDVYTAYESFNEVTPMCNPPISDIPAPT